jgi:hypothetical protein
VVVLLQEPEAEEARHITAPVDIHKQAMVAQAAAAAAKTTQEVVSKTGAQIPVAVQVA